MDLKSTVQMRFGNRMPVMGLGTWMLTRDTENTVAYAIELGYPMIDTASDYGTQPAIGRALKRTGVSRDDIYITTKVEETDETYGAARAYVREMQLDHADLILIHRPPYRGAGVDLWEGLIRAREDGVARDIGVSNYSIELMERLVAETGEVPAVNQIEWSPFGYTAEMYEYCAERGIVIQAYSPLTRTTRLADDALAMVAERYGKTPAQVLIRWNLQHGTVPIPKANQRAHLEENLGVFDFHIAEKDVEFLDSLNEEYSALGVLPY